MPALSYSGRFRLRRLCQRPTPVHVVITALCLWILLPAASFAARPFWTKTPSYVEGAHLYVVGNSTNAASLNEGKQQALINGKFALMNLAHVSEIKKHGLSLELRHTYVEKNPDGTVTVFQLLRTPMTDVLNVQTRLRKEAKTQTAALEQSTQALAAMQEAFFQKQQTVDTHLASLEQTLARIQQAQTTAASDMEAVTARETDLAQQLKTLQSTIGSIDTTIVDLEQIATRARTHAPEYDKRLAAVQEQMQALTDRQAQLEQLGKAIHARLEISTFTTCQYVRAGMTPDDVKKLLGAPAGEKHAFLHERYDTWSYGAAQVHFDAQAVVESVSGCPDS